ncbi:MAG: TIGR02147 family protein [Bdellovibrionota bacterium]
MTVFEFDDFRAYLVYVRDHYPGLRRPITLERWAKKLNYRSPRSIAMVLKGQRLPSEDLVVAFSQDLKHSENERRYFELLVRKEKHKDNIPPVISEELSKLNPRLIKRKPLEAELFSYVAEWYNYVILQLLNTPPFKGKKLSDGEYAEMICKRLTGKITRAQVETSLGLLEKLKLLERDPSSGFLRTPSEEPLIATDEVPSAAGRKHHFEQMDQAKEALVRQPLSEREFTTMTLRVNRTRLPAIKKAIREFRDKFDKDFAEDPGEDVCQLNIQFFFHTAEENK